jgi:hypothetical protein
MWWLLWPTEALRGWNTCSSHSQTPKASEPSRAPASPMRAGTREGSPAARWQAPRERALAGRRPSPSVSAHRRRQAGFSLLEALLAATVLATGVLLVSQGFSLGARAAALGRQYTQAALLAQSELAQLMLEENLATVEPEGEFTDSALAGARWSFIEEETGTAGLVRLTVTVTWGGPWGERQLTLSTLRAELTELVQTATGPSAGLSSAAGPSSTGGTQ